MKRNPLFTILKLEINITIDRIRTELQNILMDTTQTIESKQRNFSFESGYY